MLSLPVFALFFSDVKRGLWSLSRPSEIVPHFGIKLPMLEQTVVVPPLYLALLLNVTSQSVCVSGANRLTSVRDIYALANICSADTLHIRQ